MLPQKLRLVNVVVALGVPLVVALLPANAQSCNDIPVRLSFEPRGRLQMVQDIAQIVQMSIVAELPFQEGADTTLPVPGESDVSAYAKRLSADGTLECVVENGVIHIYNPRDLLLQENALNYKFESFSVPSTAELFGVVLRNRLLNEAFRSKGLGLVSGSDGGGTSSFAEKYRLTPEQFQGLSAREILLRIFRRVPMICAVEIHQTDSHGAEAAWKLSNRDMVLSVIPSRLP